MRFEYGQTYVWHVWHEWCTEPVCELLCLFTEWYHWCWTYIWPCSTYLSSAWNSFRTTSNFWSMVQSIGNIAQHIFGIFDVFLLYPTHLSEHLLLWKVMQIHYWFPLLLWEWQMIQIISGCYLWNKFMQHEFQSTLQPWVPPLSFC